MFVVDKPFTSANISRTIRFTEELFEALNETATKHEISLNLLVLQCCRYALDNIKSDEEFKGEWYG